MRHRKASLHCTFCALEFDSPAPALSLGKPVGISDVYLQGLRKGANWIRETDWSQLQTGYQRLMLRSCKPALGMWLHRPWRMDM